MSIESRIILDSQQLNLSIERICYQLIENHNDFSETVLIGLQPRGVFVAQRIHERLEKLTGSKIELGWLDITFNRDDHRRHEIPLIPSANKMDFLVEGKKVVMIDDVLLSSLVTVKPQIVCANHAFFAVPSLPTFLRFLFPIGARLFSVT